MKKRNLLVSAMALLLLCAGCGEKGLTMEVWVDYYLTDDMPWEESKTLTLPEFPGVTFTWTSGDVTAADGDDTTVLFWGMPVWNVYLSDLTGDGKPEFCATISVGSGIIDDRVVVYDYASGTFWELQDRWKRDYRLEQKDGSIQVVESEYQGPEISRGTLALAADGSGNLQLIMEDRKNS